MEATHSKFNFRSRTMVHQVPKAIKEKLKRKEKFILTRLELTISWSNRK